jgi:hypothetical protein
MKKFILIPFIALLCLTACDAFKSDANPININGEYEGTYAGKMTLSENNCEDLAAAVGSETDVKINILQSADLVSIEFDDGSEASGSLKDNTTVVVKRDISQSEIFHLEFTDEGITGSVEYIDKAPAGGVLGEPCASYDVSLTKE